MLPIIYNEKVYKIYNETANLYRLINNEIQIFFEAEWKNGSYFKIRSVRYNGKTYEASRYHYKFIPIVREATYEIFRNNGLYDYTNKRFVSYEDGKKILGLQTN